LTNDEDISKEQSPASTPFVYKEDGLLILHFEIGSVQSQMQLDSPDTLLLPYTRVMMAFLLFDRHPKHIGMIGLGGGSMQKYCYHYLPHSRITVAEISNEVIALRDQFFVPHDDHRFKVVCEDGANFVLRHPNEFDVLIVDAFDIDGQPSQICTSHFYDDCYRAVTPNGVMVVNLCDHRSRILAARIRQSFRGQVFVVDCEGGENKIAVAGKGNAFRQPTNGTERSIEYLEHHHPISLNWSSIHDQRTKLAGSAANSEEAAVDLQNSYEGPELPDQIDITSHSSPGTA
jgi:spermidine synthase